MKLKISLALLVLLFCTSVASAQTITNTLAWNQADTLANVNNYVYSLKTDTAAVVQITATCITAATGVSCTSPLIMTAGPHTYVLTATNTAGSASATLNFVPPAPPTSPTGFAVTIKITFP